MKLYLSSYRLGNDTSVLKNWLLTHDNNILVIPNREFDTFESLKLM